MYEYPELTLALNDMKEQSELYRPSSFWHDASDQIVDELLQYGVHRFRSLPKPLSFFVPTYGTPGNSFTPEQTSALKQFFISKYPNSTKSQMSLEQFLHGYFTALSDYRVLVGTDNQDQFPYLHLFSESEVGEPVEQWDFDGKNYSRSSLNYLLGLCFLKKHLKSDIPKTVLEIGGGFGTLGEVLLHSGLAGQRYINIDIPPTSYVAQYYLSQIFGKDNVATYAQLRSAVSIDINQLPSAAVLTSWQIEKLKGEVDLFVNFISFQEMEPNIVSNYLHHISRLNTKWILLRNMREGKQVRNESNHVGVNTPIRSSDYLDMLPEYDLVERNVLPFGYRTVDGYHSELLLLRRKT